MTIMKHCKKSIQRTGKSNLLMVKLHMILVVACRMVVHAIGNGAVNMVTIIDAAKASGTRPATSRAFQTLLARYENAALTRDVKRNGCVLELILNKVQIEIPPDLLQVEENDMGGTIDGSSRASANLDMDNSDGH
ncbi:unnamed protein product [Miscanthus lutarioriparius]|uniref:Uncharacterized protein n=1 Tax=Miscanthus lutarioriparius TaxID=422564 RepID=A0A811NMC5_9POAL|nr:unnamed protein product [Miscanthus lutarioriparius]